ncbi:hypothetical protein K6025_05295 [Ehrlichia sp. JZT12]
MFFSKHNLTNFFYRLCQTVNEIINGTVQPDNQLQSVLSISRYNEIVTEFCQSKFCTSERHGRNKVRLVSSWMNFLTSQLKNCLAQKNYTGKYTHPSKTIIYCDSNFNHYSFTDGLIIGLAVCTILCFSMYLIKEFASKQPLRTKKARNNIYTSFKGKREQIVEPTTPRTLEEEVEILSQNTEEEDKEEHIYENVDTSIKVASCQLITTSVQSNSPVETKIRRSSCSYIVT